jgi:alpha-galactosidase
VRRNPHVRLDHFRVDLETLRRAAPLILGVDFDPAADQCHNYRVATWIPWHGLCSRVIDPYWFRSMMCPAIVTGWDVRRTDLDYDLARRLVSEWEQIAPNYLGDFYPLTPYSFDDGVWMAWQFDRPEDGQGIVQAFRRRDSAQESATYRLRGLDPEARYTVTDLDTERAQKMSGRELMQEGLRIDVADKPGAAVVLYKQIK